VFIGKGVAIKSDIFSETASWRKLKMALGNPGVKCRTHLLSDIRMLVVFADRK
jgi:hypothetical protein